MRTNSRKVENKAEKKEEYVHTKTPGGERGGGLRRSIFYRV